MIVYRRPGSNPDTVFFRNNIGNYVALSVRGADIRLLPAHSSGRSRTYGRVEFQRQVRFVGRVRSQASLAWAFGRNINRKTTGILNLPVRASHLYREPNQGMAFEMLDLTGDGRISSAGQYAAWVSQRNPAIQMQARRYEWCHLIAHSLRGRGGPRNIVAAAKGNNTEQLAIENTLHKYRTEEMFQFCVSASLLGNQHSDARHLADVIKYEIDSVYASEPLGLFLDAQKPPLRVAYIHFKSVQREIARWANKCIERRSRWHGNEVDADERRDILGSIRRHGIQVDDDADM